MTPEHWYLLPVGCGIAVLAMSSGISAGNFWVPVYLLWATFEPPVAFWMTLATMLCGYGSGVARNLRQGTIDRGVIIRYLPLTVPAALVGGYLAPALNVSWLILLFGIFVLGYGVRLLGQTMHSSGETQSSPLSNRPTLITSPTEGRGCMSGESTKVPLGPARGAGAKARLGTAILGSGIGLLGGLLLGLITVGLGELMLPRLLAERKSLSPAEIVGSTVRDLRDQSGGGPGAPEWAISGGAERAARCSLGSLAVCWTGGRPGRAIGPDARASPEGARPALVCRHHPVAGRSPDAVALYSISRL